MAAIVHLEDPTDASRIVDALLTAAEHERAHGAPNLARRYVSIANDVGDALDRSRVLGAPR